MTVTPTRQVPASASRLVPASQGDPSEPLPAVEIPAVIVDVMTEQYGAPTERCVDDCIILSAAYAHLAIRGESDATAPMPIAVSDEAADPVQHAQDLRVERSLLFVAATRARETLAITWHGAPSRFLP